MEEPLFKTRLPLQEVYGTKRSSSAIIDEIRKDAQKCTEGLNKASTSNNELNKLMRLHITNLRLLSGPLEELQQALPTYNSSFCKHSQRTTQVSVSTPNVQLEF